MCIRDRPKNKPLIKYLSEEGIKAGLLKTEEYYMANNNREMPKADVYKRQADFR